MFYWCVFVRGHCPAGAFFSKFLVVQFRCFFNDTCHQSVGRASFSNALLGLWNKEVCRNTLDKQASSLVLVFLLIHSWNGHHWFNSTDTNDSDNTRVLMQTVFFKFVKHYVN